jgi:hypothetical protein
VKRIALLALATFVLADDWAAFGEKEWKNGTRRLVVREEGFRLLDGARVVVEGKLAQLPLEAHVLANEAGAVLFEKYAAIGYGDTLSFLGADGKLRWHLTLDQAIPGGRGGARTTISSIWWFLGWWVDEARGKAVLFARNGAISEVDLKTGEVSKPAPEVLLRAFALPAARDKALEVAVQLDPKGLREAAEKLLLDESLSPVGRLLAAVAVEKSGGAAVTRSVWDAALSEDVELADRRAAVAVGGLHVADLSLLERAARRKDVGREAVTALGERKAASELAGLVTNASIDREVRALATEVLRGQAPDAVAEAIDKEMEDANAEEGGALLNAAIATGAPDLERRLQHHEATLLKILDKETGDVSWLAGYFKGRPTSEAVQPLVKALARHKADPALRKKLIGALKPCSGEDYGDDADAWIKALAKR